jgi:hypothetical protein
MIVVRMRTLNNQVLDSVLVKKLKHWFPIYQKLVPVSFPPEVKNERSFVLEIKGNVSLPRALQS